MVVPDANVAVARAVAKTIANSVNAGSADGMWGTGLNASGTGTPTHWISSGMIDAGFASLLGNAASTFSVYQQCGGSQYTLADIQALYAAAPLGTYIRSDAQGNEQSCIAALGLQMIQGTP